MHDQSMQNHNENTVFFLSLITLITFLSSLRRSVIEAVYNRLNMYREEDGVSVAVC